MKWFRLTILMAAMLAGWLGFARPVVAQGPETPGTEEASYRLFLPLAGEGMTAEGMRRCATIAGATFASLSVLPPPTDRSAARHADLNLNLRGYTDAKAPLGYVELGGPTDPAAPDLRTLFADQRLPGIAAVHRVYDWDWNCNCRAGPINYPAVTMATLMTTPSETLRAPDSGYGIGNGYEMLVLYAEPTRLTLKYTREDNVVRGYTLHLENVCVEARLVGLYRALNAQGRKLLPALKAGQPLARASGQALRVAIRDTGSFMDPRSRKDWWR